MQYFEDICRNDLFKEEFSILGKHAWCFSPTVEVNIIIVNMRSVGFKQIQSQDMVSLEVRGNLKPDSVSSKRLGPLFCSVDQSQGHPAQCGGGIPKALLICLEPDLTHTGIHTHEVLSWCEVEQNYSHVITFLY